jgi:acyl-CoA thioester hydrolase
MNPPSVEPRAEDFPHRIVETLRFADTDRNGHITSAVFAICCQSGRLALLSDPARAVTPPSSQFVLARLVLDYRREMHWPGAAEVGTRIQRIGRSSIVLAQALFQNDRCVATAQSVAVLMNTKSRRSQSIPAASAEKLRPFAREDQSPACPQVLPSTYFENTLNLLPNGPDLRASPLRSPNDF